MEISLNIVCCELIDSITTTESLTLPCDVCDWKPRTRPSNNDHLISRSERSIIKLRKKCNKYTKMAMAVCEVINMYTYLFKGRPLTVLERIGLILERSICPIRVKTSLWVENSPLYKCSASHHRSLHISFVFRTSYNST